jgi:hypothetical protein
VTTLCRYQTTFHARANSAVPRRHPPRIARLAIAHPRVIVRASFATARAFTNARRTLWRANELALVFNGHKHKEKMRINDVDIS